ncbi:MAG TPA: hypothetical protein VFN67_14730 [Polyangiales bacterium]|nr:hypothetical protein [Polyangiales bacterium]
MQRPKHVRAARSAAIGLAALACLGAFACPSLAAAESYDPFAYDLRVALQPFAFQAAVSQSSFGSAARIEYAAAHVLDIALDGRMGFFNSRKADDVSAYQLRGTLTFNIVQSVAEQELYGVVRPADTAVVGPQIGADHPLEVPISEVMRSGQGVPYDPDPSLRGAMRNTHSLRLGAEYAQIQERSRPDDTLRSRNRVAMGHLGYAFATYWNLAPSVSGKREVGYRRFYGDILATSSKLVDATPDRLRDGTRVTLQPLGMRVGMQGSLAGFVRSAPGVGFAYDLELGLYPGRGGLEGFLFVALGIALDAATR